MEEQSCPRCKTTKYRNPSLKLMVNICGHSLCESCVELLFVRGSGLCPECGTGLRRINFRVQIYEDTRVEKELDIRKRILRDYNKREDEFNTLAEYNDYLEEIEIIIYNLTNGNDLEATKKRIEDYKKLNKESIIKNRGKLGKDEAFIEDLLEQEKQISQIRKQEIRIEKYEEKRKKARDKEELIDELMFSDVSADVIIKAHQELNKVTEEYLGTKQTPSNFSTGIKIGGQANFQPIIRVEEGDAYNYSDIHMEYEGPPTVSREDLLNKGYIKHIRKATSAETGGGFESAIACQRALQDAICGLFYVYNNNPSPVPSTGSSSRSSSSLGESSRMDIS